MKKIFEIWFLLGVAPLAFAGPKLAKDLSPATSNAPLDVIVQFKTPPTNDDLKLLGAYGHMNKISDAINAVNATISPSALAALEANPNVRYVSPNRARQKFNQPWKQQS